MHRSVRRLIFAFFVLIFVVSAPLVVLYTAGYRLNISNQRLHQTGVLAVTTLPRGGSIILNRQELAQKSPAVIQRLMPNTHDLTLRRRGYHDWSQRIQVEEGKTTYVTARLFAVSEPELLNANEAALALREYPLPLTPVTDSASVVFLDNGANVEVRVGNLDGQLIGLLPRGQYELLEDDSEYVLVKGLQSQAFILARQGGAVVELPSAVQSYSWLPEDNLLLWSDGTEVNIYDAQTNQRTFITREGQPVLAVAWHPAADSFFVASTASLSAYDMFVYETREVIPLLANPELTAMWLDAGGRNLYFTKTDPTPLNVGSLEIYELPLSL